MLRLTHLYQAHRVQEGDGPPVPSRTLPPANDQVAITEGKFPADQAQPAVAIEVSSLFGKVTVSDATFEYVGSSVGSTVGWLITNASCQIDAVKEVMGLRTLNRTQAEELANSGILDGEHWKTRPSQQFTAAE